MSRHCRSHRRLTAWALPLKYDNREHGGTLQGTAVMDLVVYRPGQQVIGTYLIITVLL